MYIGGLNPANSAVCTPLLRRLNVQFTLRTLETVSLRRRCELAFKNESCHVSAAAINVVSKYLLHHVCNSELDMGHF